MKHRGDYVTNSSSSNFILAKKGNLNQKQKDALVALIEKELFGETYLDSKSSDEEVDSFAYDYVYRNEEEIRDEIREMTLDGYEINMDWIDFEMAEHGYIDLVQKIWKVIEENSSDNFKIIDGSLEY